MKITEPKYFRNAWGRKLSSVQGDCCEGLPIYFDRKILMIQCWGNLSDQKVKALSAEIREGVR